MKSSAKAISSPSRTEKFPPPLMRFLRSNVGSRSRGRSRASPSMFMRKNKNNVTVIETTQEPSSPKVTCIGQVRVRRSSKSAAAASNGSGGLRTRTPRSNSAKKRRKKTCWWRIHKTLFCNNSKGKCYKLHKPKSLISVLKKCVCWRKRVETVDSSTQRVQNRVSTSTTESCGTVENVTNTAKIGNCFVTENKEGFLGSNSSSSSSPPKNALLLTRCRSAPYRSSSLASRFWGSPLNSSEEPEDNTEIEILKLKTQELEEKPVVENPISPNGENGNLELRKSHESEEMKSCNGESSREEEEGEEKNGGAYVHPLLLTRCKSEPAKRGERLNPDSVLSMQRRSTDPDSQT